MPYERSRPVRAYMDYGWPLGVCFAKARTSFDGTGIVGLAENYRRQVLTIQLQKESRGAE